MHVFIFLFFLLISPSFVYAQENEVSVTGLAVPRFVSLAKDEVFVRSGPGKQYPVKWVLQRKGLPVEIIDEFEHWRKIRDYDGDEGWVFQSLLSGVRAAIIVGDEKIFITKKRPVNGVDHVVETILEPSVVVTLRKCDNVYCLVDVESYSGWIERKFIWGVYEHENID